MQMKDVCARTGLTDRAVRLYVENGLVSPHQEVNYAGRRSLSFSEEDVRALEDVATLRRAAFSLTDIAAMQSSPEALPALIEAHRQKLAEDIETKAVVLDALRQIDVGAVTDCRAVADALRQPLSRSAVPAEDSRVRLSDRERAFLRRLPVFFALLYLLFAVVNLIALTVRAIGADAKIVVTGGYRLEWHWENVSLPAHAWLLTANAALLLAAAALIVYLAGGKRRWILVSGALIAAGVVCLLLLPFDDADRLYNYAFLYVRYSFLRPLFLPIRQGLIRSLKYWPLLPAVLLGAVGFFLDRAAEQKERRQQHS